MVSPMEEEVSAFSFPIPAGFAPPDTAEDGKPFEVTASVIMRDGKLILDSLNGAKLAAEEAEDDELEEDEELLEEEIPETDYLA